MGYYSEYLDKKLHISQNDAERKKLLRRISALRGDRDIIVYASDIDKPNQPPGTLTINYSDKLPFHDQLANLHGEKVDLILETPGGSGEVAEDIVHALHAKYKEVGIIVPGCAKSAGTIIAMAGDEILMEPSSCLGPIDAQMQWQGKVFSADAFLEGMEKIKNEVVKKGSLNRAYIPILQAISPGEIQHAQNAMSFAKTLVSNWLAQYKFKNWTHHSSTGLPVTDAEKSQRAQEIADVLCDHKKWLSHSRSIKLNDLRDMRLEIMDYSEQPELCEAIQRYFTLLQILFDSTNLYKIFETTNSQILRFTKADAILPVPGLPGLPPLGLDLPLGAEQLLDIGVKCQK
jgi:hypothetical protein